jgi:hypothetical protein
VDFDFRFLVFIKIFKISSLLPGKVAGFYFAMESQRKRQDIFNTKIYTIMKELIEILTNEDKSFEGLPKWVYIFAMPAALVLMCMIGGTLS